MKQVNKLLENVNKEMNAAELAKVMEKFEQVSFRLNQLKFFLSFSILRHSKTSMLKSK